MDNPTIAFIIAILSIVTGAFIVEYYNSGSPILFLENGCDSSIRINSPEISYQIRNRGEVEGYSSFCIFSDKVIFKDIGNTSDACETKRRHAPMSSGLVQNYESGLEFIEEDLPNNFTIRITFDCSTEVWGIKEKPCDDIVEECKYVRMDDFNYQLLRP